MLQQRLASHPEDRAWTAEGTAVFVDVSGFTRLSEQLARKGREGSEQITEVIGAASSRFSRSPTTTARACSSSAAMRCCSGSRTAGTRPRAAAPRAHAPRAARRRHDRRPGREDHASHVAGHPLAARSTSSWSATRITSSCPPVPHGAGGDDGAPGRSRRDPRQHRHRGTAARDASAPPKGPAAPAARAGRQGQGSADPAPDRRPTTCSPAACRPRFARTCWEAAARPEHRPGHGRLHQIRRHRYADRARRRRRHGRRPPSAGQRRRSGDRRAEDRAACLRHRRRTAAS